jgi:transposase
MRKPLNPSELGFSGRDCKHLVQALKRAASARLFRRIQAVLLVAQGRSFIETSAITGLSLRAVYHLVQQYLRSHRVEVLQDKSRSGRPPVAPDVTSARILRELQRVPLRLGYPTTVWTVKLLARHLSQRYRCSISARTLRRRMKQMDLRCKRPRYVYSEKDPHRAQKKGPQYEH